MESYRRAHQVPSFHLLGTILKEIKKENIPKYHLSANFTQQHTEKYKRKKSTAKGCD